MLLAGENDLLSDLYELGQTAATDGARRHVGAGLSRRLLILQKCRVWLQDECNRHETTVSPYLATDLSIYVNAYYVNLCGALDNLAWLLVHEFRFQDPVNEDDKGARRLAALTSKEFRRFLSSAHPTIAKRVEATVEWHWEVRNLRDPAAHRLPLTVIAGVLDEDDHREAQRLQKLASEAMERREMEKGFALLFEASKLGKFHPWLENPEGYQKGFFYIPNLIARDQAFFVDLAGSVSSLLLEHLDTPGILRRHRDTPAAGKEWPVGAYLKRHEPFRSPWDELP